MLLIRSIRQIVGGLIRACVCAAILVCVSSTSKAADREIAKPRGQLDVILLFDASGSMLKTDSQKLRYQGAKLLLSFLGEGDRLGVIQFAGAAKVVSPLEQFSVVRGRQATEALEKVAAEGEFTDIAEGLKLAASTLEAAPRPGAQRVIVLLSDGKMEPDPKVAPSFARTLELVHDLLPELKAKETKVFTLSFSDQADRTFLGEIAAATEGLTWFTQSVEEIHKSFAELFLAMKRPQVVAQTGRGFAVDVDVTEATFYINHAPEEVIQIITPQGGTYSSEQHPEHCSWFAGKNFDVITVSEPDPGNWQVAGTQAQDGFATVMTDLRLLTDWPLTVRAGDEPLVQARLYDRDKPVSLPEMSGVLTIGYRIIPTDMVSEAIQQEALNDGGVRGDKVARDGIFSSSTTPMRVGSYKLVVVAKGPTFQRSQQIPFTVHPRLVSLSVHSASEAFDESHGVEGQTVKDHNQPVASSSHGERDHDEDTARSIETKHAGDEHSTFLVTLSKEAVTFKKVDVELIALSADRQKTSIPMKQDAAAKRTFKADAGDLPKDGAYKVKAVLRAEVRRGEMITAESPVISFDLISRVTRVPVVAVPRRVTEDSREEERAPNRVMRLPLTSVILVSLCNLGALVGVLFMLGTKSKKTAGVAQKYLPHKQLLDAIAGLEERVQSGTIELDDPILQSVVGQAPTDQSSRETGGVQDIDGASARGGVE